MGSSESSVIVSLREIMQLERDRVAAEEDAARAAEARAAQAARDAVRLREAEVDRTRALERERERRAEDEAERRRAQHEAALLRVRLEVEARERAERERLGLEHQRALRRLDLEVRSRHLARALVALLVTGTAAVAVGYGVVVEPALRAVVDREGHAQRIAEAQVAESAARSRRVRAAAVRAIPDATTRRASEGGGGATVTSAVATPSRAPARIRVGVKRPSTAAQGLGARDTSLDDLDDESEDPIEGMLDPEPSRTSRKLGGRTP